MIYLEQNNINIVSFTLGEYSDDYNDINNYIIRINNKQNSSDRFILLKGDNNLSLNRYRYDEYAIELVNKNEQDVLSGILYLPIEEYTYSIVICPIDIEFDNENEMKEFYYDKLTEDNYNIIESGLLKVNKNKDTIENKPAMNTKKNSVSFRK